MSDRINGFWNRENNDALPAKLALDMFMKLAQPHDHIDVLIAKSFFNTEDDEQTCWLKFILLTLLYSFKQMNENVAHDITDIDPVDFIIAVLKELTDPKLVQTYPLASEDG